MKILAERIRTRKNELGISTSQLAKTLYLSTSAVQQWLTGATIPRSDMIPEICAALDCTPDYLFGLEPSAEPEEFEWCTDCKEYDQNKHFCHRWTKVIRQTVEELKQAQPEQRWIPCSERLPEEDYWTGANFQYSASVLMTVYNAEDEENIIDYGHTVDGKWYSETTDCPVPPWWKVTAWMPLPEPYKGGQDGQ